MCFYRLWFYWISRGQHTSPEGRHINFRQNTAQKMKFSIKDSLSKCRQIPSFLRIWSHLLKQSLMENLNFRAVEAKQLAPATEKYE